MHALDFTAGRAAIAYTGELPWHGFGFQLQPGAPIEEWQKAAGLNYEVYERPVFYGIETPLGRKPQIIKSRKALLRSDTQSFLSIVGSDYKVVQPSKVFAFFRDLVAKQGLEIETAGALKEGNIIWALAKIDDDFTIFGQDRHQARVLVATSYDTSLSTCALLTDTRVVCNNTLTAAGAFTADGNRADVFKVRHDQDFNITEAHGKLGLNEEAWNAYRLQQEALARFTVTSDELLEYFYDVAGQGDKIVRNEDNGNVISFPEPGRVVKQFINAYKNGPGSEFRSSRGTLYGALNAVTFYQDHLAPAGDRGKRFASATFGGGNVRKQHALELAVAKLEAA